VLPISSPIPPNSPADSTPAGNSDPITTEPDSMISVGSAQALVPYAQTTPFQRAQGLRSAQVILDAAYPFLVPAQWQQALDYLQLPLYVRGGQASFLSDGLGTPISSQSSWQER
jgi:hypothetical protein